MTRDSLDLRLAPAALTAWLVAAVAVGWPPSAGLLGAGLLLATGGIVALRGRRRSTLGVLLVVAAAALAVAALRGGAVRLGPVPGLADQRAQVSLEGRLTTDPVVREGQFEPYVLARMQVRHITGRGRTSEVSTPVLVIGDESWSSMRLGETLSATGRLAPPSSPDLGAVLYGDADPQVEAEPGPAWRAVDAVRRAVEESVATSPREERALVPALVDGQESADLDAMADDFATAGLTHLLAVSGSNLTLVLSFALVLARTAGVRGRWLSVVAVATVAFFVMLARPEPSVLRAAAMGVVGIAGLAAGGRQRGSRALCVAVVGLVLLDPWLARSPGFVLSTLATAGILAFGRSWSDALGAWMPAALAEAVAIPLAAQLACTPAVAALSGQVSVVAVLANVAAAPAVGPATVLGLVGGVVSLVSHPIGHLAGRVSAAAAWWIVAVAHTAAGTRGAAVGWPATPVGLAVLVVVCAALAMAARFVLVRRPASLAVAAVMVVGVLQPWGRIGWPPDGWVLVMCDVGQGDGLVLSVGDGSAVVVDTGPDPALMDHCLDDLGVDRVRLVVLTHFHADHIDGLPGVLEGRQVDEIEVSPLAAPADGAAQVAQTAAEHGVPTTTETLGETWRLGDLSWQTLGPTADTLTGDAGTDPEGSVPNNASIVMRVDVDGLTLLLTGDAEPEEENAILAAGERLGADVVKVSHHGSASQEPDFYARTGAAVALISVGADNDYGHPSPATVSLMEGLGMSVYRTDDDGAVAVVRRDGGLAVVVGG